MILGESYFLMQQSPSVGAHMESSSPRLGWGSWGPQAVSAMGELCRQHRFGAAMEAVLSVLSCSPVWLQHLVVKGCSAPPKNGHP